MDSIAVLAGLLLALVFAVAGAAKLSDLAGSRRAVADFGVPPRLVPAVGLLVPLAEIAVAAALIIHPTARWGAAAALFLLLVFVAGVANAMRQGKDVDCGCFGPIYSATAGSMTLVRNAVLAALALFLLVNGPGPAIDEWFADRTAAELLALALGATTIALAVAAFVLWRGRGRLKDAILKAQRETAEARLDAPAAPGLSAGTQAPDFSLTDLDGATWTRDSLLVSGLPLVLIFSEPTCGPCNRLVAEIARWRSALGEQVTVAVVAAGSEPANRQAWDGFSGERVLLDPDKQVFDAFGIGATPTAVPIHPDGRIAGSQYGGKFGVEMVTRLALRRAYAPSASSNGDGPALRVREFGGGSA